MEKLEDSNHFVTLNQVPSFDVSTRVLDVYEQLVQLGRGGFILDTDEDRYFIKAGELAEETIFGISAKAKSLFGVETTIGELCFDSRISRLRRAFAIRG